MSEETASGAPLVEIGQGFGQAIEVIGRPTPLPAEEPPGGGTTSGDDVRAEHAKIVTDPTHPMHEGYLRRDPKVLEHIDNLYRKRYGSQPVELGQGIEVLPRPSTPAARAPEGSPEASEQDAAFRTEVMTALQNRAVDLTPIRAEADHLFAGAEGDAALAMIEDRVLYSLAPSAEVKAHLAFASLMGDLHRIRSMASPTSASGEFSTQLEAGLRKEFGGAYTQARKTIDVTLQHMFAGPGGPAALATVEARLFAGLAPGQRVQAAVRTARALVELGNLRQYRS